MTFDQALTLLRQGKKLKREGWQSVFDPEYIYIEDDKEEIRLVEQNPKHTQLIMAFGYNYECGRRIDIWNESFTSSSFDLQADLLAEDWEEYKEESPNNSNKETLLRVIKL